MGIHNYGFVVDDGVEVHIMCGANDDDPIEFFNENFEVVEERTDKILTTFIDTMIETVGRCNARIMCNNWTISEVNFLLKRLSSFKIPCETKNMIHKLVNHKVKRFGCLD